MIMARMIYVDELTEAIGNQLEAHRMHWNDSDMSMNYHNGMLFTLALTLSRPVVDAVPVVRCKDCKHSEYWYRDKCRCSLWSEIGIDVFEDGFCSYGERRDDD
jgi:hypothetical protein